jgi:hypothetical protein
MVPERILFLFVAEIKRLDVVKRIGVGTVARIFTILGVSSIVAAVFCAFYFSDARIWYVSYMPYYARFPLGQYSPLFAIAGVVLLGAGWILSDYVVSTSAYALPRPATLAGKSRKRLATGVVLVAIVLGAITCTYVMADTNVTSAARSCTSAFRNFEVAGTTLLANLTIRNPSNMILHLNKFQARIYIRYPNNDHAVSVNVSHKFLPANGYVSILGPIHAGPDAVNFLMKKPYGYEIAMSNTYDVTSTWLFWTISKEATERIPYPQPSNQP